MRQCVRFLALVIATVLIVVLSQVAFALSPDRIYQIAKEITVLIDGCQSGSGVIVQRNGNTYSVLTAKHVFQTEDKICLVITPDGARYPVEPRKIQSIQGIDLAVVQFTSNKTYHVGELGNSEQATPGKTVYVAGAPSPTGPFTHRILLVTPGNIVGLQPPEDGYTLIYSNSTRPGMSGGPVLDEDGRVIGIHGQGDRQDGDKTGLNLGIPIQAFLGSRLPGSIPSVSPNVTTEKTAPTPQEVQKWWDGFWFIFWWVAKILGGILGILIFIGSLVEIGNYLKANKKRPQPARTNQQVISKNPAPSHPPSQPPSKQVLKFDIVTVSPQGQQINRGRSQAEFFPADLGNGIIIEMVSIPGGKFIMGSPDTELHHDNRESPQHEVTVAPFSIGKTPVTQAQWKAVAALPQIKTSLKSDPSNCKGANRPVERVSWYDVIEFCARLSKRTGRDYRLPSEAEWEYACRAGTTTPFHFGETITTDLANYDGNYTYGSEPKGKYRQKTTVVGSFNVANAFGLYDMHGNVWEWCADPWHENYNGAPSDGKVWENGGDDTKRLLRGGAWSFDPRRCRAARRSGSAPDSRLSLVGFRVVACSVAWTL